MWRCGWRRCGASPITEALLGRHCHTLIAGYKTPRSFEFVDALPLAPTGKVLKRDFRGRHWNGVDRQIH
jgi:long-chain acyl-CoA synthetase